MLTLIQIEIRYNELALQVSDEADPNLHFLLNPVVTPMSLNAWKDGRVRLAQLLSLEHFIAIANYYNEVRILLDIAYSDHPDDARARFESVTSLFWVATLQSDPRKLSFGQPNKVGFLA